MQFDHHGPRFFFLFVFLHFGLQPLVVLQRLFPTFHCHVKTGEDTTVPEKHQHTENQVTEHNMHAHRVNPCNERKKDPRHTYQTFLFFPWEKVKLLKILKQLSRLHVICRHALCIASYLNKSHYDLIKSRSSTSYCSGTLKPQRTALH